MARRKTEQVTKLVPWWILHTTWGVRTAEAAAWCWDNGINPTLVLRARADLKRPGMMWFSADERREMLSWQVQAA